MSDYGYLEPIEETLTRWHNPLDVPQRVDIRHGDEPRPTRFTIKPGETVEIPSRYDYAIQVVQNGVIVGGLAPQLRKMGSEAQLDPALDTEAVKKKDAEVAAAAAALVAKTATEAVVVASAKAADAASRQASKASKVADAEKKNAEG